MGFLGIQKTKAETDPYQKEGRIKCSSVPLENLI